ncbi:MAG: DNA alkylation repair protein [Gemmatimonadota bacterium]
MPALHVKEVIAMLEKRGSKKTRDGMARYGIVAPKAFGVPVGVIQQIGKNVGKNHQLAAELWESGWYEARMLTAFIDDPALVTSKQMDDWVADFDNWAICDTLCFHLFDRTAHAWTKVGPWSRRREEFVRRSAFALLAGLSLHDKKAGDEPFLKTLAYIERCADDDRNFVKKGVSWAFRVMGRRSAALHDATLKLAREFAKSSDPTVKWQGNAAIVDLTSAAARKQVAARKRAALKTSGRRLGDAADSKRERR